jgi:hypothetical protein
MLVDKFSWHDSALLRAAPDDDDPATPEELDRARAEYAHEMRHVDLQDESPRRTFFRIGEW